MKDDDQQDGQSPERFQVLVLGPGGDGVFFDGNILS